MELACGLDPDQRLDPADEETFVRLAVELGYGSAWTPSGADAAAFDRCLRWFEASGLPVGISVVPASGRPAAFYAEHAARVWERTGGNFVLGVGSGGLAHPATALRAYLVELRAQVPAELPIYLAALGPRMLALAGELADGVALNWCTPEQIAWSRQIVEEAAAKMGRTPPRVVEYIRSAVDDDGDLARTVLLKNASRYGLGPQQYRRHFERMGLADALQQAHDSDAPPSAEIAAAVGAAGRPGEVRPQIERLGAGLDVAIIRVLAARPGSLDSAARVLRECAPLG